jgi:transposase
LAADRTSTPCHICRAGVYVERDGLDDMSGLLHCSNCGSSIDRWVDESNLRQGQAKA